jgi:arylsulfatase A-like enzyme/Flp pilus assembly protein TadD
MPASRAARWLVVVAPLSLFALILAIALPRLRERAAPPEERSLLLITLDTTRADALCCYGGAGAATPHLDALARRGVRFARCATCTSLTAPSHSSIMTSLYPYVHTVRRNGTNRLPAAAVTLAETLHDAGFCTAGSVAAFVLNRPFGFDQGFDEYIDVPAGDSPMAIHAERAGASVAEDGIAALKRLTGQRFFLWLHFYDPHFPYDAAPPGASTAEGYAADVTYMDVQIGRVLQALDDLRLRDRTVVAVIGDHGEAFGEHREFQHGYFTYQTTLAVPFLLVCPKALPEGHVVEDFVRTIDLAPTVLELLGVAPPAGYMGRSLLPVIAGEAGEAPAAYAESIEAAEQFGLAPLRAIMVESHKYIHAPRPEVYTLASDPAEATNLAETKADLAAELRAELRQLLASAPPPLTQDADLALSPADLARLTALGYVGGPAPADVSALEGFDDLPAGDPKDYTEQLRRYGESHWAMLAGRFALAEELLADVVADLPAARPLADLAFARQNQGKLTEAAETYAEAIAAAPEDGYVRRMYAGLLIRQEVWAEAAEQLAFAVADRPADTDARFNLAVVLARLDRLEEARAELREILEVDPRHVAALHAMGAFYARENRLEEAIGFFRKALEIDPAHSRARHDLEAAERSLSGSTPTP